MDISNIQVYLHFGKFSLLYYSLLNSAGRTNNDREVDHFDSNRISAVALEDGIDIVFKREQSATGFAGK
jgi:hypothetical protein